MLIVGAVVSCTVIVNVVGVATLPAVSVFVQVIVVVPIGNVDPDNGVQLAYAVGSTLSVARGAVYVTIAPLALVASARIFVCVAINGAIPS